MDKTKIDWADSSWNPVTGCLHGCPYCYARKIARRFGKPLVNSDHAEIIHIDYPLRYHNNSSLVVLNDKPRSPYSAFAHYGFFNPTFHRYRLNDYLHKKGRTIFVCSMADLFGDWVPDEWIEEVFRACEAAPQHRYLFLTKNPKRYEKLHDNNIFPNKDNFWFGTTITRPSDEIPYFQEPSPSYKGFVSIEPILEPFAGLAVSDWVIIGAETGQRKDRIIPERWWIEEIVESCQYFGKPVFMKESLRPIWGDDLIQEYPWDRGGGTVK